MKEHVYLIQQAKNTVVILTKDFVQVNVHNPCYKLYKGKIVKSIQYSECMYMYTTHRNK